MVRAFLLWVKILVREMVRANSLGVRSLHLGEIYVGHVLGLSTRQAHLGHPCRAQLRLPTGWGKHDTDLKAGSGVYFIGFGSNSTGLP